MNEGEQIVVVGFTIEQARALLCTRNECNQHSPKHKSEAWSKLARATQDATRQIEEARVERMLDWASRPDHRP